MERNVNVDEKRIQYEETRQFVVFRLGGEEYAVNIMETKEIVPVSDITRVPRAPEFIRGVMNLRGEIVPLLDLRRKLGKDIENVGKETKIVVVEVEKVKAGLLIDEIVGVLEIPVSAIEPPPKISGYEVKLEDFLEGIGKVKDRIIMIINLHRMILGELSEEVLAVRKEEALPAAGVGVEALPPAKSAG